MVRRGGARVGIQLDGARRLLGEEGKDRYVAGCKAVGRQGRPNHFPFEAIHSPFCWRVTVRPKSQSSGAAPSQASINGSKGCSLTSRSSNSRKLNVDKGQVVSRGNREPIFGKVRRKISLIVQIRGGRERSFWAITLKERSVKKGLIYPNHL